MPRPREYDEAELLARAMDMFWSRGYRGTSIEELVTETGVSRASLYSAYSDKRELFVESVKRYLDSVVQENVRRLREIESPAEAIRQFFLRLVEAPLARLRRGCLLTNTAVELGVEDKQVAALIRSAYKRVETALHERLVQAQQAGELAAHVEPRAYARQLITLLQGIRVMARVGVNREVFRDAVGAALSALTAATNPRASSAAGKRARIARRSNGARR